MKEIFGGREPRMKQILEVGMIIFGDDGLLSKYIPCLMSGVQIHTYVEIWLGLEIRRQAESPSG